MEDYSDIINLPHHVSDKHERMSVEARAAQFAPFAALTGYEGAIKETERLTEHEIYLDEYEIEEINNKLFKLKNSDEKEIKIRVTYFKPDDRKEGGEYICVTGIFKRIKDNMLILEDGSNILVTSITQIEEI